MPAPASPRATRRTVSTDAGVPILPLSVADAGKYTFAGNIPSTPNVSFSLDCNAPKHILWDVLTRSVEDGGGMKVLAEGRAGSVWPIAKDGARVFAFDVNDEIVTIDPKHPCKPRHSAATSRRPARPRLSARNWRGSDVWTWRVITTKVPLFRGVTGSLVIVDGPGGKNTCTIKCVGCFDNRVPACIIQFVLKFLVLGKPLVTKAQAEFAAEGEYPAKYKGPKPPPK
jgi:hypothetical protein